MVQFYMTGIFDDPQTYETASTLEDCTHDLQLMGWLILETPTEPDVSWSDLNLPARTTR